MRRVRNALTIEAADDGEQSFQGEAHPPAPPRRRRGRPRSVVASEQEQQLQVEPEALELDPTAFVAGMAGINQGLVALNQAMPLVQQMLQQRNQGMTDADALLLYSKVGRISFDGIGDALDFINTIDSRTRTGYTDY